jgi:hypothetical protein
MYIHTYVRTYIHTGLAPNNAAYYGNRAAALIMTGAHQEAANDCLKAISLDPKFIKVSAVKEDYHFFSFFYYLF